MENLHFFSQEAMDHGTSGIVTRHFASACTVGELVRLGYAKALPRCFRWTRLTTREDVVHSLPSRMAHGRIGRDQIAHHSQQ